MTESSNPRPPQGAIIPEARPVDEPARLAVQVRRGDSFAGWEVGGSDGQLLRLRSSLILPIILSGAGLVLILIALALFPSFLIVLLEGTRKFAIGRAFAGLFVLGAGGVTLQYFVYKHLRLGESLVIDGMQGKVTLGKRFGLQQEQWEASNLGAVQLTIEPPMGEAKETARVELLDRRGEIVLEVGHREMEEKTAGFLAVAAFQIACILKLPCQVDGMPTNPSKRFRKALDAIAWRNRGQTGPERAIPLQAPSAAARSAVSPIPVRRRPVRKKSSRRSAEQRRNLIILGVVGAGVVIIGFFSFVAWGIFADKSPNRSRPTTPEGAVKEYHASLKEGIQLMKRVTDEASAREAKPLLEVNTQRIRAGKALIDRIPFSERENERLGRKYLDELTELQDRYQNERLRVAGVPGASTILGPIINDPLLLTPP